MSDFGAYARRQAWIRRENPLRVRIADLILHYKADGVTIQHIQDANQPAYRKEMPASLIHVLQEAHRQYGRTKSAIRCHDCGELKPHEDLAGGVRCGACRERAEMENPRVQPVKVNPDPWCHGSGRNYGAPAGGW